MVYDTKELILGSEYDPAHPVLNFLKYKSQKVDGDKIVLAKELDVVRASGFLASPDTMHSFWTTYTQALKIWYGQSFTLKRLPELIELYDSSEFAEVNSLFSEFAVLTHTRGNYILMPAYVAAGAPQQTSDTNLNLLRYKDYYDYWDLTLQGVQTGKYDHFFSTELVAPQFRYQPDQIWSSFMTENNLWMYCDDMSNLIPLWEGHLDTGTPYKPQTKQQVEQFLETATSLIKTRAAAL